MRDLDLGLDRYDLNARLKPALFALLPLLFITFVWQKAIWASAASLLSAVVFCGALFLVSRIARHRGRIVQRALETEFGGLPTTIALRHSDATIDASTKARYHAFLRRRGLHVPDEPEEQLSAAAADQHYRACTSWLLEATRDQRRFKLIADENIDYGFRRNLLGIKPIALFILVAAFSANAAALAWQFHQGAAFPWEGVALQVVLALIASTWLFVVNIAFVRDAAWAYATRLLAACDALT